MPGPRSTPAAWLAGQHANKTIYHGIPAREAIARRSGKTSYDKKSGKWVRSRARKAERILND